MYQKVIYVISISIQHFLKILPVANHHPLTVTYTRIFDFYVLILNHSDQFCAYFVQITMVIAITCESITDFKNRHYNVIILVITRTR
jgi:hypothetical protein